MIQPAPIRAPKVKNLAQQETNFAFANVVPFARRPVPHLTSDVAIEDFDDLLGAVTARPGRSVGEWLATTPEPQEHDTGGRVQARERRVRHLPLHDSLTSLANRSFFRQRLDHALADSEPQRQALAVLYLDLDGFKRINDAHGRATGDELLRIVAARLTRAVRDEDMVSRLGGDKFACLLGGVRSREQLSHLAGKLFDAVAAPCKIGQLRLTVCPSIGIAMCPADGATAEALLKNADAAMYRAKLHQTGHAFFDQRAPV